VDGVDRAAHEDGEEVGEDRLKGWRPLLQAFQRLKADAPAPPAEGQRHRRRRELVRLVLAGPDPGSIQDDPEARDVLAELVADYRTLPPAVQADVALLTLPMASPKRNALMVNVLQRSAVVVVQNSLREGFGLTVTEAMWKRAAVLASSARGLRLQIRDGLEGRLVEDPEDVDALARALDAVLADARSRELWGNRARRRVYDEFLVFTQLQRWLELLAAAAERSGVPARS
jgi:trehalose synthase